MPTDRVHPPPAEARRRVRKNRSKHKGPSSAAVGKPWAAQVGTPGRRGVGVRAVITRPRKPSEPRASPRHRVRAPTAAGACLGCGTIPRQARGQARLPGWRGVGGAVGRPH